MIPRYTEILVQKIYGHVQKFQCQRLRSYHFSCIKKFKSNRRSRTHPIYFRFLVHVLVAQFDPLWFQFSKFAVLLSLGSNYFQMHLSFSCKENSSFLTHRFSVKAFVVYNVLWMLSSNEVFQNCVIVFLVMFLSRLHQKHPLPNFFSLNNYINVAEI